MTRVCVALCLSLLMFAAIAGAAVHPSRMVKGPVNRGTDARPPRAYKVHDVGTFWTATSNFGNYGEPNFNLPSGEWPAGSEVYYIWEGRFWIGAIVGGEMLCSHADYNNYEFDPSDGYSFYAGSGPKSIMDTWCKFDDRTSYTDHTPIGFEIEQRSLSWSLPEYDDFIIWLMKIKNVSGGTLNGVMPSWVFDNDVGAGPGGDPSDPNLDDLVDYDGWSTPGYPDGTNPFRYDWVDPLDLDGDGKDGYDYWGWPLADPRNPYLIGYTDEHAPDDFTAEPDGIYDEYQIYEVEGGPKIYGQPGTDFEGDELTKADGTPLTGYLISRNMSYMLDGDFPQSSENDIGERNTLTSNNVAGFIGTRLIYMPELIYNTTDDDTMPRPYSHQWWNWESDPGSDLEKYEYMAAIHELSAGMDFMPHPFDYPGSAPVFDYRYMHTAGPYNNWQDKETKKFVMVTAMGWGLKGLRENIDAAYVAYYKTKLTNDGLPIVGDPVTDPVDPNQLGFHDDIASDAHFLLPIPPQIPDLHYSAGDGFVNLVWDNAAETSFDNIVNAVDFEGYKIYRSKYNAQNWMMMGACDNVDGPVYLLNAEGDTLNPIDVNGTTLTYYEDGYQAAIEAGTYQYIMVDLPDIFNSYVDDGGNFSDINGQMIFKNIEAPINGLKYYYAVVSYDPAKPARGLPSIESAKSNYRKTLDGAPDPVMPRTHAANEDELANVRVVPNPYKGTALFESRYEDQISFINLPPLCKITIYTMTGDMVDEIYHSDAISGEEYWNLISRNNQKVVSGLYIYSVESPNDKKIGKFLIIR